MKVFERPGPVNTESIVDIIKEESSKYKYIVVASVSGESALRVAAETKGNNVVCVTCPQGMNWETDKMKSGPFADIPELKSKRDGWISKGLKQVPMQVTEKNKQN